MHGQLRKMLQVRVILEILVPFLVKRPVQCVCKITGEFFFLLVYFPKMPIMGVLSVIQGENLYFSCRESELIPTNHSHSQTYKWVNEY